MRRKLMALGVVTALVGSGVVIGTMVPAASQQGGTITVCDQNRTGYNKDISVGKKGFSPGDFSVFTDKLLNPQTGRGAGRLVGRAVIVKVLRKPNDALFIADLTTYFPKGKITWYGPGKFRGFRTGLKLAITGGTGIYNQARGGVIVKDAMCRGRRGLRLTFNLTA